MNDTKNEIKKEMNIPRTVPRYLEYTINKRTVFFFLYKHMALRQFSFH